jgi:hypothetical protein
MVFLDTLLRKIIVYVAHNRHFYLVKVCAWCPKNSYPILHHWQTYTHGLCKKHYGLLQKRDQRTFISIDIEKIISLLFPQQKTI